MITLKTLKWDNAFSYGKGNVIEFDKDPITQLVGKNGHGKSSIALVLEEVLYNKNSKGIKKSDILNRYTKDKAYNISLTFAKDGEDYEIKTSRGTTQSVSLTKNGEDVSSHTSTATLRQIETILGIDHKAFAQLVYQSSSSSLEFLTATDTNRKKFLIDLLNLSKYVDAFEVFKSAAKEANEEVLVIEAAVKTTQAWLDKNKNAPTEKMALVHVPPLDPTLEQSLAKLQATLANVTSHNKAVTKNNQYRQNLEELDATLLASELKAPKSTSAEFSKVGEFQKVVKDADAFIGKIAKLDGTCPTCLQQIDRAKIEELIAEQESLKKDASDALIKLNAFIKEQADLKKQYDKVKTVKDEYEQYHSLIDNDLTSELLDSDKIKSDITELECKIGALRKEIKELEEANKTAQTHNARVEVVGEQREQMLADLATFSEKLAVVGENLTHLQMLQKTFSTSGLVAYKIECLVKDLEQLANEYLAELSGGRFQLMFKINASDKLNVIITDNGKDIDILALSGGERARVNTATLLAIRKLMQSLSNARINLLILDETIDALDVDGKEKLVETLLNEEHLNTFLVSHGFTHPLLEKITVIKENNISRLE